MQKSRCRQFDSALGHHVSLRYSSDFLMQYWPTTLASLASTVKTTATTKFPCQRLAGCSSGLRGCGPVRVPEHGPPSHPAHRGDSTPHRRRGSGSHTRQLRARLGTPPAPVTKLTVTEGRQPARAAVLTSARPKTSRVVSRSTPPVRSRVATVCRMKWRTVSYRPASSKTRRAARETLPGGLCGCSSFCSTGKAGESRRPILDREVG